MKRVFFIIIGTFLASYVSLSQTNQDDLPVMCKNASTRILLDKSGEKYLEVMITDISIRNSSLTACEVTVSGTISSIGQKTKFGNYTDILGNQKGHKFDFPVTPSIIPKNGSATFKGRVYIGRSKKATLKLDNKPIFLYPVYDGSDFVKEKQAAREKAFASHDSILSRITNKVDSIKREQTTHSKDSSNLSAIDKRNLIFTPKYYTNFIGTSSFTIATIEKEFEVYPIKIDGLSFFYLFENVKCNSTEAIYTTFNAVNEEGVVAAMHFKLLGESYASAFIKSAIEYGYKYYSKGKDIIVTTSTKYLLPSLTTSNVKVYRIRTKQGYVYIEIGVNDNFSQEFYISIYRKRN